MAYADDRRKSSRVKICDVPFDNSYEHVLTFSSLSAQQAYFSSRMLPNSIEFDEAFTKLSYLRSHTSMRLKANKDQIPRFNYIGFINTDFPISADGIHNTKWYYFFVTEVRYVNDFVCEIFFEPDYYQTYMFDITIGQGYIEREHILDDNVINDTPEPIQAGNDYYINGMEKSSLSGYPACIVAVSAEPHSSTVKGSETDGVYSGLQYFIFSLDNVSAINNFLDSYIKGESPDRIISIFHVPRNIISGWSDGDRIRNISTIPESMWAIRPNMVDTITRPSALQGYTPKNMKLFTYPYSYLEVTNNEGVSNYYEWERFNGSNSSVTFGVFPALASVPTIYLVPALYKCWASGTINNLPFNGWNWEEKITMTDFPQGEWVTDNWKLWQEKNLNATLFNFFNQTLNNTQSAFSVGSDMSNGTSALKAANATIDTGQSYVNSFADLYTTLKNAKNAAPTVKGLSSANINYCAGIKTFMYLKKSIPARRAEQIDNFFEMFGYQTNLVKKPNMKTRPNWNYVKASQIHIKPSASTHHCINSQGVNRLKAMFANGVTFWHNPNNIGDYSQNNH